MIDALPQAVRLSRGACQGRTAAMVLGDLVTYQGRRYGRRSLWSALRSASMKRKTLQSRIKRAVAPSGHL